MSIGKARTSPQSLREEIHEILRIRDPKVNNPISRIADEITTTFARDYAVEVSLSGSLQPAAVVVYRTQSSACPHIGPVVRVHFHG